ncbi:MAG: hypothetical protein ACFFAM_18100 [Promethearchaeota archaeon]
MNIREKIKFESAKIKNIKTINLSQRIEEIHGLLTEKKVYFFSLLFIIGSILRIPPTQNYIGDDTALHLLLAQSFLYGDASKWLINPLSYMGYYPGAYVPILEPLILSMFIVGTVVIFGKININLVIILFSIMILTLSIHSSYLLARYFFTDDFSRFLFVFIYILIPNFLRLSVYTAHARGLFIAIVPYFFLSYFKLLNNVNRRTSVLFLFSSILLLIVHKVSIICFVIAIIAYYVQFLLTGIIHQLKKPNQAFVTIIIAIFGGIILGFLLFPSLPVSVGTEWFSNKDLVGFLMNLGIFYFFKYGMILVYAIIGFILLLTSEILNSEETSLYKRPSTFIIAATPFLGKGIYLAIILGPIITILSTYLITRLFHREIRDIQLAIIGTTVATFLVILMYGEIYYLRPFDIIFTVFGTAVIIFLIGGVLVKIKNNRSSQKDHQIIIILRASLIISFFVFSSFSIVLFVHPEKEETFPYTSVSIDEIIIANVLKKMNIKGMFICYDYLVGRRISGQVYLPDLGDSSLSSYLIFDYIQTEEIINSTYFVNFLDLIDEGIILEWAQADHYTNLWFNFMRSNYSSDINNRIRSEHKIEYVITERNSSIARSPWGKFESAFLNTMEAFEVFETKNLKLWKLVT